MSVVKLLCNHKTNSTPPQPNPTQIPSHLIQIIHSYKSPVGTNLPLTQYPSSSHPRFSKLQYPLLALPARLDSRRTCFVCLQLPTLAGHTRAQRPRERDTSQPCSGPVFENLRHYAAFVTFCAIDPLVVGAELRVLGVRGAGGWRWINE